MENYLSTPLWENFWSFAARDYPIGLTIVDDIF